MFGSRTARAGAVARTIGLSFALAAGAAGRLTGQDAPTEWRIIPAESRLTVSVFPAGLLASALHRHHFQPADWTGEISWDPARPGLVRVLLRVAADSLR